MPSELPISGIALFDRYSNGGIWCDVPGVSKAQEKLAAAKAALKTERTATNKAPQQIALEALCDAVEAHLNESGAAPKAAKPAK